MQMLSRLASVITFLLLVSCKAVVEERMEELCRVEAGQRVYEAIRVPASGYEKWLLGQSIPTGKPDGSWFTRFGDDEYRIVHTRTYLVGRHSTGYEHEESLVRNHAVAYRWSDKKVLGEEVYFAYSGGTRFTFGFQPHGASCPAFSRGLAHLVFVPQTQP